MEITLESLGLTKKAVEEKAIEVAVEKLLYGKTYDDCGNEDDVDTKLHDKLKVLIKERIDETINVFAEKHVLPKVSEYIENIVLQTTNKWGEKKGEPLSFIEYLIERAEEYMKEQVDNQGKSKSESGGYSWSGKETRITHLIHQHLKYNIEKAAKESLKSANDVISEGICKTVEIKLKEVVDSLKVNVSTNK